MRTDATATTEWPRELPDGRLELADGRVVTPVTEEELVDAWIRKQEERPRYLRLQRRARPGIPPLAVRPRPRCRSPSERSRPSDSAPYSAPSCNERGRDSNPRWVAPKRFSRPLRKCGFPGAFTLVSPARSPVCSGFGRAGLRLGTSGVAGRVGTT